jgi:hypothetical protein
VAVPARLVGTLGAVVSAGPNVAVTVVFDVTDTVHVVDEPLHPPPDQPVNVEPVPAAAVSVTDVPELSELLVHVEPQLMPPVFEVTVPEPAPDFWTVRVKVDGVEPPDKQFGI